MTPTKLEAVRLAAVLQWQTADDELQRAKAAELDLRARCVLAVFPGGLSKGTTNHELHDGSILKAVMRPNAKVDQDTIGMAILKLQAMADGILLAKRLVKYRVEASIAELDKLTPGQRKLFAGIITVSLSGPTLELKTAG